LNKIAEKNQNNNNSNLKINFVFLKLQYIMLDTCWWRRL